MDLGTLAAVAVIGAGIGLLGGAFGKGGSALATPLLAVVGLPALVALASPLPATIPATFVAALAYHRVGLIDWRLVRTCVLVGAPATVVGALATRWIGGAPLVVATEVILLVLGARFLVAPHDPHEVGWDRAHPGAWAVAVAAAVGLASGLLANSGGFLLAPLFVVVLRRSLKTAFGTSLVVAGLLAVPGTVVHAALGHIDWTVTLVLAAAATPMSRLGVTAAWRVPSHHLERVYGAALALLAAGLLATA